MPEEEKAKAAVDLDDEDDGGEIVLVSGPQRILVSKQAAFMSRLVKAACEADSSATELAIPRVKLAALELAVKYMEHHNGAEPAILAKPLGSKIMADVCKDKWDADFMDNIESNAQLYDLMLVVLPICRTNTHSTHTPGRQFHGHSALVAPGLRQGRQFDCGAAF